MKKRKKNIIQVTVVICIMFFCVNIDYSEAASNTYLKAPILTDCYISGNAICIKWEGVKKEDGYQILRKETGGKYRIIAKVKRNCRKYTDKKIVPGKKYVYSVRAFDKKRKKISYSNYNKAGIYVLEPPVITAVEKNGKNSTIIWNPCKGVDGYRVYYKTSSDKEWKLISQTTNQRYTVHNFKKSNYYTVRSYKKIGNRTVLSNYDSNFSEQYRTLSNHKTKTIVFYGASTVYGSLQNGNRAAVPFAKRVSLLTGTDCINLGHPGDTVTKKAWHDSITGRIERSLTKYRYADIICINVGTNDYKYSREIGEKADIRKLINVERLQSANAQKWLQFVNAKKKSLNTYYGALSYIVFCIKKQNPSAKIVLMTPQFCGKYGSKKDINAYRYKNAAGYTLKDYANAVKVVGEFYNVLVYDSEEENIVNFKNYKTATVDYIHATQYTYIKVGDSLVEFMRKNNTL